MSSELGREVLRVWVLITQVRLASGDRYVDPLRCDRRE